MSTLKDCIDALIKQHGTLRAAARAAKLDPGYLSRLRYGEKSHPSDETLAALGIECTASYRLNGAAHPVAAPEAVTVPAMKDHQTRELVNEITALAEKYGHTQQLRELIAYALAARPSPPAAPGWLPIETAPENAVVVVAWWESDETPHYDFDQREDGCWQRWHDHAEHVEVIGGHGVSYTAPYTHWMRLGPIPVATEWVVREAKTP